MGKTFECECGSRLFDLDGVSLTATGKVVNYVGTTRCSMCRKPNPTVILKPNSPAR